jgi:hypothetical protein
VLRSAAVGDKPVRGGVVVGVGRGTIGVIRTSGNNELHGIRCASKPSVAVRM